MLEFFKTTLGSYGWAIIFVTIIVKLILYPLTKKQTESMQKMQALQPRIKILQERFNQSKERYKDRPAKLKEVQEDFQKDMMEFYQTYKVNPLGGCFPMLIQLPILIAIFWAFNGSPFKPVAITAPIEILNKNQILNEQITGSSSPIIFIDKKDKKSRLVLSPGHIKVAVGKEIKYKVLALEGKPNGAFEKIKWQLSDKPYYASTVIPKDLTSLAEITLQPDNNIVLKTKNPGKVYLNAVLPATSANESFLFIQGLGKTGAIDSITGKLNFDVVVLVILFALTIWLSGKTTGMSVSAADPKQAETQKTLQKIMPVMVGSMTLLFPVPAGVLLYFVVSGLIQALQSWVITRTPITIESMASDPKEEEKPKTLV